MKRLVPLLCLFSLAACSGKAPAPQSAPAAASTARVATPWDNMEQAKQRAADVQKTVDDQAKKQQQQIDEAQQ
jgi:hypothetical protein